MRYLYIVISLSWKYFACLANNGIKNESININEDVTRIRTSGILQSPCLLSRVITKFSGQPKITTFKCLLQGIDSAAFGPQSLEIDGLDANWINSSPHSIKPGITTLFIDGATISGTKLILPDGMTLDDVEASNPIDDEIDSTSNNDDDDNDSSKRRSKRHHSNSHHRQLVSGEKTVLAVYVTGREKWRTSGTPEELYTTLFDTNSVTVRSHYNNVSYGKFKLVPTTAFKDIDGFTDGLYILNTDIRIVDGVTRTEDVELKIDVALTIKLGRNWEDKVDHIIYVLPWGTQWRRSTNWLAYAYAPGKWSIFNDREIRSVDTVTHEIGHNINLDHSNDANGENFPDGEYDDNSCVMGGGIHGFRLVQIGFNGAKSFQLGWYEPNVAESTVDWSGRIYGVVDYQNIHTDDVVILRMIDSTGNSRNEYYIAFNRRAGFNIDTAEGWDKVLVTKRVKGIDIAYSWLEAELDETSPTFVIPEFGGEGLSIDVVEINLDASPPYALLNVVIGTFYPNMSSAPTISSLLISPTLSPKISPTKSPRTPPSRPPRVPPTGSPNVMPIGSPNTPRRPPTRSPRVPPTESPDTFKNPPNRPPRITPTGPPRVPPTRSPRVTPTRPPKLAPEPIVCILDDECIDDDSCTEDKCIDGLCSNMRVLSSSQSVCGNMICESDETCENCPEDCRRRVNGKRPFCCYGGPKEIEPTFMDTRWSDIARSCEYSPCQRYDRQCDTRDTSPNVVCKAECSNDLDCDDNNSCTKDSCMEGVCVYTDATPTNGICGDGICQDGENCETCPQDCKRRTHHGTSEKDFCCYGGPSKPTFMDLESFDLIAISCVDLRCEEGSRLCDTKPTETDIGGCGNDCLVDANCDDGDTCTDNICVYGFCLYPSVTLSHGWCGDDICQDGENCENCPEDCRGRSEGDPERQFCCYGGPSKPNFDNTETYDSIAVTCEYYKCQRRSKQCNISATRIIPDGCEVSERIVR